MAMKKVLTFFFWKSLYNSGPAERISEIDPSTSREL